MMYRGKAFNSRELVNRRDKRGRFPIAGMVFVPFEDFMEKMKKSLLRSLEKRLETK